MLCKRKWPKSTCKSNLDHLSTYVNKLKAINYKMIYINKIKAKIINSEN
jgi:hypothetical protein